MSQLSQSVFRRILARAHYRCIDLSTVQAQPRNFFPRKIKISGLNIQCKQNYLFQHCGKPLKIFRETNYCTELLLLSSLSGSFNLSRAFFARYFLTWKKHNHLYNTAVNTGGKCDILCSSKNLYFHKFFLKVITPQLPPGKIGKHCVVLKLLTCPAESVLTK